MHFKPIKAALVLGVFFFTNLAFAQVKISELLQHSDYHTPMSKQKLFMIEFWATWCGPCITVSDYLDILQELNNNFFIMIKFFRLLIKFN